MIDVLNLLRDRGVHVRSISDGIDPTTSTGRLMLNMLATLAEYERELIIERVNACIAAARQNGTRFGRPVSDPVVIADKLAVAQDDPRGRGDAAELPPRIRTGLRRSVRPVADALVNKAYARQMRTNLATLAEILTEHKESGKAPD